MTEERDRVTRAEHTEKTVGYTNNKTKLSLLISDGVLIGVRVDNTDLTPDQLKSLARIIPNLKEI